MEEEYQLLHFPSRARGLNERCRHEIRMVANQALWPEQPDWMRALETDSLGVDLLERTWLR